MYWFIWLLWVWILFCCVFLLFWICMHYTSHLSRVLTIFQLISKKFYYTIFPLAFIILNYFSPNILVNSTAFFSAKLPRNFGVIWTNLSALFIDNSEIHELHLVLVRFPEGFAFGAGYIKTICQVTSRVQRVLSWFQGVTCPCQWFLIWERKTSVQHLQK